MAANRVESAGAREDLRAHRKAPSWISPSSQPEIAEIGQLNSGPCSQIQKKNASFRGSTKKPSVEASGLQIQADGQPPSGGLAQAELNQARRRRRRG